MVKQTLNAGWSLKRRNSSETFPASVPTSVYTVLAANGQIPEPYWKGNEDLVRDVINDDFLYTCTFDADPELFGQDQILLRFDGIDTIADIYLNDVLLGHTFNMHRIWEFSPGSCLKPGSNKLEVLLHSPLKAADQAFADCPTRCTEDA